MLLFMSIFMLAFFGFCGILEEIDKRNSKAKRIKKQQQQYAKVIIK